MDEELHPSAALGRSNALRLDDQSDDANEFAIPSPTRRAPSAFLRGLSQRASSVGDKLSKSLTVAQQWTKEKIGKSSNLSEIEWEVTAAIQLIAEIAQQSKALEKALASMIQAQQQAVISHQHFAAYIKTLNDTFVSDNDFNSASAITGAAESIEVSATPKEETLSVSSANSVTVSPSLHPHRRSSIADTVPPMNVSLSDSDHLLPQFLPYTRRLLAGRLQLADENTGFLNHLQTFLAVTVKPATHAVNQLDIDRLHNDACQSKLQQLTTTNYSFNSAADEYDFNQNLKQVRERADTAHTTLERAKIVVSEHASHLLARWKQTVNRGLNQCLIVEREQWITGQDTLSKQRRGEPIGVSRRQSESRANPTTSNSTGTSALTVSSSSTDEKFADLSEAKTERIASAARSVEDQLHDAARAQAESTIFSTSTATNKDTPAANTTATIASASTDASATAASWSASAAPLPTVS